MTISRWILLRVRNVLNKSCNENQDTLLCSLNLFSDHCVVYEIMSKNVVEPEMPQMTKCRRVPCWISKATLANGHARARASTPYLHARASAHTHTHKYVIILIVFPQQKMFLARVSVLRSTYMASLVHNLDEFKSSKCFKTFSFIHNKVLPKKCPSNGQ
jgi:hypothetical protein